MKRDTSVGKLSPQQGSNPRPPEHWAGAPPTELRKLMEGKVNQLSSYVTGVMNTARISTVEVIVSSDERIKILNFKLGN